MKDNGAKRRFQDMTLAELRDATKQYDAEVVRPKAKPAPPALAARHAKAMKRARAEAKAKRGRPPVGRGAAAVLVSIEKGLLTDADKYRLEKSMSRSELIALGLRLAMALQPGTGLRAEELAGKTAAQIRELVTRGTKKRKTA
jgi:hypothetical protein